MERRVLFAIFLCFIVLYIWQGFVVKPVPKPVTGTPDGCFLRPRRREPSGFRTRSE